MLPSVFTLEVLHCRNLSGRCSQGLFLLVSHCVKPEVLFVLSSLNALITSGYLHPNTTYTLTCDISFAENFVLAFPELLAISFLSRK